MVGSYTVTYSATDTSGNTATKTRTVQVVYNGPGCPDACWCDAYG